MESGFDELGQKSIIAGKIIIVSGPSSAGKGTVVKQLVSMYENYELAIETTSREPRLGETDGIQYHFISEKAFLEAIKKNKFFEYSRYIGSYYGTLKDPVYSSVKRGKNVVLEMSSSEALQLKRKYPEMILVYILPPDLDTIIKRLTDREQDNERVRNRLSVYSTEAYSMLRGDLLLVNDDLVRTVRKLVTFINNPFEIDEDFDDHAELVYSLKKGIEQYLNTESYKSSKSSHRDTFNEATAAINLSMELREIRAMLDSLIGGKEIIDVNGKSIGGVMKVNNEEKPISPQDKGDAFIEDISYISEIRKMKLPELTFKNFILMFVNHSRFRMNMTKMEIILMILIFMMKLIQNIRKN